MHIDVVDFARQIIAMDDRICELEIENSELRGYRQKYTQSLRDGVAHGEAVMGGLLKIALTPGIMEACAAAKKEQ